MYLENPCVVAQCGYMGVPKSPLITYLSEQYGQLGEDLLLQGLLRTYFSRRGLPLDAIRYLDVGANHPIQTSNTYIFGKNWGGRGVLVEANPELIGDLTKVRTTDVIVNRAVVPVGQEGRVRLNLASKHELSSLDIGHVGSFEAMGAVVTRAIDVEGVTLDSLLEAHFPDGLHLLSIDIEGVDQQVMASAVLKVRPYLVVVEPSRHYHEHAEYEFDRVMRAKNYFEIARTEYNNIYVDVLEFDPKVIGRA